MSFPAILLSLFVFLAPMPKKDLTVLEGRFGGLHCALHGMECKKFHAEKGEPIALVIALKEGKIIHVERVPVELMKKYFLKTVKITGEYFDNAKTMMATKLEVKGYGGYKEVWHFTSPKKK